MITERNLPDMDLFQKVVLEMDLLVIGYFAKHLIFTNSVVSVSLTGKIFKSKIRNLWFNFYLHQKLIDILV